MENTKETKKTRRIFTTDEILNRVKESFPRKEIHDLYQEGQNGNIESAKKAKLMFAKAFGRYIGEVDYVRDGYLRDEYINVFLEYYKIEGFDTTKNLDHFCRTNDSGLGIAGYLNKLVWSERCPMLKQTIARLIQSFDPEFNLEEINLPSGYSMETNFEQRPAIEEKAKEGSSSSKEEDRAEFKDAKEAFNEDEDIKTDKDAKSSSNPFTSFFSKTKKVPSGIDSKCGGIIYTEEKEDKSQAKTPFQKKEEERKRKKASSVASCVLGICAMCGGIIYALNTDDKNKKAAGWTLAATGAFFTGIGTWIGGAFQKRPMELLYISRKFTLDSNYLASCITAIHNGRFTSESSHLRIVDEYSDINRIFQQELIPILNGKHQGLNKSFTNSEDKMLFVEMARSYIGTWYKMIEEFPDVLEAIMTKKRKNEKDRYITSITIIEHRSDPYYGKAFIEAGTPQPWGYGIKPTNWREGDPPITKEDHDAEFFSKLDLTQFPECHCDNPTPAK